MRVLDSASVVPRQVNAAEFEAFEGHVADQQVIEQVGDDDEERRLAALKQTVDDRGGDMRLAAAAGAGEDEPTRRGIGEGLGVLDTAMVLRLISSSSAAAAHDQCPKREARQR